MCYSWPPENSQIRFVWGDWVRFLAKLLQWSFQDRLSVICKPQSVVEGIFEMSSPLKKYEMSARLSGRLALCLITQRDNFNDRK